MNDGICSVMARKCIHMQPMFLNGETRSVFMSNRKGTMVNIKLSPRLSLSCNKFDVIHEIRGPNLFFMEVGIYEALAAEWDERHEEYKLTFPFGFPTCLMYIQHCKLLSTGKQPLRLCAEIFDDVFTPPIMHVMSRGEIDVMVGDCAVPLLACRAGLYGRSVSSYSHPLEHRLQRLKDLRAKHTFVEPDHLIKWKKESALAVAITDKLPMAQLVTSSDDGGGGGDGEPVQEPEKVKEE